MKMSGNHFILWTLYFSFRSYYHVVVFFIENHFIHIMTPSCGLEAIPINIQMSFSIMIHNFTTQTWITLKKLKLNKEFRQVLSIRHVD